MATKTEERAAYSAGRALTRANWPEDFPADKRKLGEHHNPFDQRDQHDEYTAWLQGLRDALLDDGNERERADLLKRLEGV